jgi:hypothetical protein
MSETLDQFLTRYSGGRRPQVIEVGPDTSQWPVVLVRSAGLAALVHVMHVFAGNPDNQHLCIDVHPFVDGRRARAGVLGMEHGRRISGLRAEQCDGTAHGLPAAHLVNVIIGRQQDMPAARLLWERDPGNPQTLWQVDGWSLATEDDAWWLTGPLEAGLTPMFLSTDLSTAFDRAGAVIAAFRDRPHQMGPRR